MGRTKLTDNLKISFEITQNVGEKWFIHDLYSELDYDMTGIHALHINGYEVNLIVFFAVSWDDFSCEFC